MRVEDMVIGRVSGDYAGYRNSAELVVSVSVQRIDTPQETTDHRTLDGVTRLSISAGVWNRARTDFLIGGQCRDALDNMVSYAPGWNRRKVRRLGEIWDAWHLNDAQAGCDHQVPVMEQDRYGRTVPSLSRTPPCPVTGYKYGHAWLARELPDAIIEEIAELCGAEE